MILALIPQPVLVQTTGGSFELTAQTAFARPADPAAARVAELLAEALGLPVAADGEIRLELDAAASGEESYTLDVDDSGVLLRAATAAGLFRGGQTLRQLVDNRTVPYVHIADEPRFGYRSAMLDVARHFFGVTAIKRLLDQLAVYKFNRLHLHLSDDQGWRIELPSRPELTVKASGFQVGDGPGGFYTQADYAEIVAYAADRFIELVPEIDVPGHVNAAVLAYPEIGADWFTAAPYSDTRVGFSALAHDKEQTYAFLTDVFTDLAAMSPGRYLHIGGDEVDKMAPEHFDAFVQRAARIAAETGKTVVGWEEIVKTGVSADAVAQYWGRHHGNDDEPFRAAMRRGTKAIVSPASRSYLDMKYDEASEFGLDWAGLVGVRKAYEWDPAEFLGDVPTENILGLEGALWSETVATSAEAEYLLFPRLPGLAEIGWSPAGRDWDQYRPRLAAHADWWTTQGWNYYRAPEVWQ